MANTILLIKKEALLHTWWKLQIQTYLKNIKWLVPRMCALVGTFVIGQLCVEYYCNYWEPTSVFKNKFMEGCTWSIHRDANVLVWCANAKLMCNNSCNQVWPLRRIMWVDHESTHKTIRSGINNWTNHTTLVPRCCDPRNLTLFFRFKLRSRGYLFTSYNSNYN